jgi:hypothetical protein
MNIETKFPEKSLFLRWASVDTSKECDVSETVTTVRRIDAETFAARAQQTLLALQGERK